MRKILPILLSFFVLLLAQSSWIGKIPDEARNNPNIPKLEKPKTETAPKILNGQADAYTQGLRALDLSIAPRSSKPKEWLLEPTWTDSPDETLHYDRSPATGIGLTSGGTFYGAVRFTPLVNCTLKAVLFFQWMAAQNGYVYVFGPGDTITPGAVLDSVPYTGSGLGWKRIDLTTPLVRNAGVDFWTGVRTTHIMYQYPLGADSGPMIPNRGGFITTDRVNWYQLANLGMDRNWNQRAIIAPIPFANDMATISIDNLTSPQRPGQWLTIKATVKNVGSNTRSPGVPVRMQITGPGSYSYSDNDQTTQTTLNYNQTEQITFVPNWRTPTTLGIYTIKVWTALGGDQNLGNDTAQYTLEISNWITYANWNNPYWVTWAGRERGMIFYPVEFGVSYPIRIDTLKTQFESLPSQPWTNNQFQFKVYSGNLQTVLYTSPMLNAVRDGYGTFVCKHAIPSGLTISSGGFMVAVRTADANGLPSTLGDNDFDFRSVYGDTNQWYYWMMGELFIASFVTWTARSTDVGFFNLHRPFMYTEPGVPINPLGVVKNYGTVNQTSVACSCFVIDTTTDARIYSGTATIASISAGDTAQALFSPTWTPPSGNNVYEVAMATFLPIDSNPANDAIYHVFFGFHVNDPLVATSRTVPVTIDGIIQTSEWTDANKYDISNILGWKDPFYRYFPGNGFLYLKHDATNLYLACDMPFLTTNDTSEIGLYFDENNDGAWATDSSEGNYWIDNFPDTMIYRALPSGWRSRVFGAVHRQSSSSGHLQFEMALPLGSAKYQLNLNSAGDTCGFYAYILNVEYYMWLGWWKTTMDSIYWNQPAYYGKLVLSPYVPPPPDVGVIRIDAPTGSVDTSAVVTPTATFQNFSADPANFKAFFWIKDSLTNITVYFDSLTILGLAGGSSTTRSFNIWPKPHSLGPYLTRCSTYIAGDINYANDTLGGSFRVTSPPSNVGVVSIDAPIGALDTAVTIIPQATLRNFGTVAVDFKAFFLIKDSLFNTIYFDSLTILGLASNSSIASSFDTWPKPHNLGQYTTRCSTYIAGDINHTNDTLGGSFQITFAPSDVGVIQIDAPTGTIDTSVVVMPMATFRNFGTVAVDFKAFFWIKDSLFNTIYFDSLTIFGLAGGSSTPGSFNIWPKPHSLGQYTTRCSTYIAGDINPANDTVSNTFTVSRVSGNPDEWKQMADINLGDKTVYKGGCIAFFPDSGWVYGLKGNNRPTFAHYSIATNTWTQDPDMPFSSDGKKKKPKLGAALLYTEAGPTSKRLYATKGGNRNEWWCYGLPGSDSTGWKQLADVPTGTKRCKGGTILANVTISDTDFVLLVRGSKTSDAYLYNPETNTWSVALPGVPRFDKKSAGVGIDDSTVLAVCYDRGSKTNPVYLANLNANTWTKKTEIPLYGSTGRKKKVKEGVAAAYDGTKSFMFKGGNTKEFFDYIVDDSLNERSSIPITSKKGIKAGGSLVSAAGNVWALAGTKTNEFWRYTPVPPPVALAPAAPSVSEGTMGKKLAIENYKLLISPNPAINLTAIDYSLSVSAPVEFKLYNITGAMVKSYANTASTKQGVLLLDTKALPSGVYILRFNAGDIRVTRKLILEK